MKGEYDCTISDDIEEQYLQNLIFLQLALQIHCSESSKEFLDKLGGYTLEPRGLVEMKVC